MFRKGIKKILEIIYKPLLMWYLGKDRKIHFDGLELVVKQGVFHPLFFYSTKILLGFLKTQNITGKTLLEPGCGSGLLSVWAARHGAEVTAFDINKRAVENTLQNGHDNHLKIKVIESDLFSAISPKKFDYILINPPYYPRTPADHNQAAWLCGPDFEYFEELFKTLPDYYGPESSVMMVLSEDCDLNAIKKKALKYHQHLQPFSVSRSLLETNYLFRIVHQANNGNPAN